MRWIPVTERLPEGSDAISCEAWCAAEEPGEVAGPCIMHFDADADEGDRWTSREDTGCWEPGPVTHWRSRPSAPGQEDTMGVIGADGKKHHLFLTRAEEDAAVARSPLKVADDLITLAGKVGAAIPAAAHGVQPVQAPSTEKKCRTCAHYEVGGQMEPCRGCHRLPGAKGGGDRWMAAAGVSASEDQARR